MNNTEDDDFSKVGPDDVAPAGERFVTNPTPPASMLDLPISQRGGVRIPDLLLGANTGAQGKPMPNYTADAADTGGRIAKLLERNLREIEADKGYGRLAAALSTDIATGGRTPYAMTAEALEGKEIGQTVNIANAMAAVGKIGQGDVRALGNLMQRQTEFAAKVGNMRAQRINEMVRSAAAGFADPAMAQAHMYGFLFRKQQERPELDLPDLPNLMAEAIMDARRSGIGGKPVKGEGGGAAAQDDLKGIPMKNDGTPDFTKRIPRATTEWARTWNAASPAERDKMWRAKIDKATGSGGGGGVTITTSDGTTVTFGAGTPSGKGAQDKQIATMNESLATADNVAYLIDTIRGELDKTGASSIGALGKISLITGGLKSQVDAALSSMREGSAGEKREASTLGRMLDNADQAWRSATGGAPKAAWLTGDNSESAQRLRTNIILLAYVHAKAMDQGGRIARDDVENTMRAIGETGGDPRALNAALTQLFNQMKNRIESNWMRTRNEEIEYIPGRPIRRRGEATRTSGEGVPSPAVQKPEGMSDADWQDLQNLRRAQ